MVSRWYALLVLGSLVTWVGCSGESTERIVYLDGHAGSAAAGRAGGGGHAGKGGKAGAGTGGTATGGTDNGSGGSSADGSGGTTPAEGGSAAVGHTGGTGALPGAGRGSGGGSGLGGSVGTGGSGARGGSGGFVSTGGAAGRGNTGGTGGSSPGGRGGTGGSTGGTFSAGGSFTGGTGGSMGGSAGSTGGVGGSAGNPPPGWSCSWLAYGDGKCDCGCGAQDIDCKTSGDLASCQTCNLGGSCSLAECPGRIDPSDTRHCLAPPNGWTCDAASYGDGRVCDCGCGAVDMDCDDATSASCDSCWDYGACSHSFCPSSIVPNDNSKCVPVPPAWYCESYRWGDGTCDCGCGAVDVDCPSPSASDCTYCPWEGCGTGWYCYGNVIQPDNNAVCTAPPARWSCSARAYDDGNNCDCGCGAPDPDCAGLGVDACTFCNGQGSCSAQACPGLIDPQSNYMCDHPAPPPEWSCSSYRYADGYTCDCGCGAPDLDCATSAIDECDACPVCGPYKCPSAIDPADTTRCLPPPAEWTCNASRYGDGPCDCGCGIIDVDCYTFEPGYCSYLPVEGCSGGHYENLDPNDNSKCKAPVPASWTCNRAHFGDGECDCGCGAVDVDCASSAVSACKYCKQSGSCATGACPGNITPSDNSTCSAL